jgi:hypothetical protein
MLLAAACGYPLMPDDEEPANAPAAVGGGDA